MCGVWCVVCVHVYVLCVMCYVLVVCLRRAPERSEGARRLTLLPAIPNDVQCFLKYVFVILRGARQIHFCATLSQPIVNRGTEDRVAAFLRHIHPVDQLFIIWFSRLVIPRL